MPHTLGPYQLVVLDAPLSDWTGARFVIRSKKHAPGGVAVIIGGTGEQEEGATARLFQQAPELLKSLKSACEWMEAELQNIGGCDHSVGICSCGDRSALAGYREVIAAAEKVPATAEVEP
jgi:hypothetical protein